MAQKLTKSGKPRKSRLPRLPIAHSRGGDPEFQPTEEEWQRIEQGYGHRLPASDRDEIVSFVVEYFRFEPSERNAPHVEDALNWLMDVSDKADALASALGTIADGTVNTAAQYAADLVDRHVRERPSPAADFNTVTAIKRRLLDFSACCDLARRTLTNGVERQSGFIEGTAWNTLVWRLTDFAKQRNLPFGASKFDDPERASPFVCFVRELQRNFPAGLQRHQSTNAALTQAINVARRQIEKRRMGGAERRPSASPETGLTGQP